MRARDVTGKRIAKVKHRSWYNKHLHQMETTVESIDLEDGTILVPFAFETEEGPVATIYLARRAQKEES